MEEWELRGREDGKCRPSRRECTFQKLQKSRSQSISCIICGFNEVHLDAVCIHGVVDKGEA